MSNEIDRALNFFSKLGNKDTAFTYMASAMYLHHLREHIKKNPQDKTEIIEALELLLTELKSKK